MQLPSPPSRRILRSLERLTAASYAELFGVWTGLIVVFAAMYLLLSYLSAGDAPSGLAGMGVAERIGNSLYFSTVTATTVGYGDIVPLGWSKAVAALEAMLGFFVFCVFISKLVSHKTETATSEVHTLMFESKFHHAREGLFHIRKDFDAVIGEAQERGTITEDSWDKIAIASWEGERLLESILFFYSGSSDLFTLDATRERLLLEATHRTLERLHRMLQTFDAKNIRWQSHEKTAEELMQLLAKTDAVLREWQTHSANPRGNAEWFERVQSVTKELKSLQPTAR